MPNQVINRRQYQRLTTNIICKVQIGKTLEESYSAEICDISAGGIRFRFDLDDVNFEFSEKIYIQLYIYDNLKQLSFVLEGDILRIDENICAVRYKNIDKHIQCELDRIISESIERGMNDMIRWDPGKSLFHKDNI